MADELQEFTLDVNGQKHKVKALPDTPLLWVLRDNLNLTATKYGCGVSDCGCCTVLIDGKAKRSCGLPVDQVGEQKVVTLEGLSATGDHPVQKAWLEEDVPQCGYCQTGQIISAVSLLASKPKPTDADIDRHMANNICRCGTYDRIRKAIKRAAAAGGGQ